MGVQCFNLMLWLGHFKLPSFTESKMQICIRIIFDSDSIKEISDIHKCFSYATKVFVYSIYIP